MFKLVKVCCLGVEAGLEVWWQRFRLSRTMMAAEKRAAEKVGGAHTVIGRIIWIARFLKHPRINMSAAFLEHFE